MEGTITRGLPPLKDFVVISITKLHLLTNQTALYHYSRHITNERKICNMLEVSLEITISNFSCNVYFRSVTECSKSRKNYES